MALVKTKRKHRNGYGKKQEKKPGDEYDHPSPSYLAAGGFVTLVSPSKEMGEHPNAGDELKAKRAKFKKEAEAKAKAKKASRKKADTKAKAEADAQAKAKAEADAKAAEDAAVDNLLAKGGGEEE